MGLSKKRLATGLAWPSASVGAWPVSEKDGTLGGEAIALSKPGES